jgi:hypothetical protein
VVSHAGLLTVGLCALVLAGCGSTPKPDSGAGGKTSPDEVKSAHAERDEALRQKKAAEDSSLDLRRELERVKRELDASRETASKSEAEARLSQDMLVQQKKLYDQRMAEVLAQRPRSDGGTPEATAPVDTRAPVATPAGEKIPSTAARFHPIDLGVSVATVDGEPVSRREFVEALYYNYANTYLDTYLSFVLVHREARRVGISVSDAEAERDALEGLARVVAEAGGDGALDEKLEQMGITREALLSVLRANGRTTATMKKLCLYERGTPEGKARLEKKVRESYDRTFGEKADARHLFIPLKPETTEEAWQDVLNVAKELKKQLETGADWAAVAKQAREKLKLQVRTERQVYSRASFTAYSELDRAALERAVFEGKEGEVSDPVRWKGGVSLIRVERHIPPEATFEEKKALIAEDLTKAEITPDEPEALIHELREKAKIEKHLELDR